MLRDNMLANILPTSATLHARSMSTPHPLVRLGQVVSDRVLPLARQTSLRLSAAADHVAVRLLGRDFEERLRRVPLALAHGKIDPFGFDLETAKRAAAVSAVFHRAYFRTQCRGVERVPSGRVLLIANHSGQIPIDGMLIGSCMFFDAEPPRFVRSMVEKWTQTLPFVGTFLQRIGQVVGVPENARRLLAQGEAVLVFPEGARGVTKPFAQRYQLTPFGLGFMRLALETNTPIVPISVIGGEEQYISLHASKRLGKLVGAPSFPVVPQWLLPGGQLPLPTKYRIEFGEPLYFDGDPDDEDAAIAKKVKTVRDRIQDMLAHGLAQREHVFW
jgi:1-acyl-sn-glycerol-3-phosphate acyltransferase